ncbi:hypothetical protein BLNAU_19182 [Blattamonas nauphoetae]|uniref:Uncharacterized protein n=1 Tax=Blattamonas nauphoetae TaxID=2049346 RepID=A0ABQ9X287_9EUKA|nr:hypothetical protein BLNAU_19182 [Blattamonas nauphoetae]
MPLEDGLPPAHIFVVDGNFTPDEYKSILSTVKSLPPNALVSVISFTSLVTLYSLNPQTGASSSAPIDCVTLTESSLDSFHQFCNVETLSTFLDALKTGRIPAFDLHEVIPMICGRINSFFVEASHSAEALASVFLSLINRTPRHGDVHWHRIGDALSVSVELSRALSLFSELQLSPYYPQVLSHFTFKPIRPQACHQVNVILVANGPPNCGDGATTTIATSYSAQASLTHTPEPLPTPSKQNKVVYLPSFVSNPEVEHEARNYFTFLSRNAQTDGVLINGVFVGERKMNLTSFSSIHKHCGGRTVLLPTLSHYSSQHQDDLDIQTEVLETDRPISQHFSSASFMANPFSTVLQSFTSQPLSTKYVMQIHVSPPFYVSSLVGPSIISLTASHDRRDIRVVLSDLVPNTSFTISFQSASSGLDDNSTIQYQLISTRRRDLIEKRKQMQKESLNKRNAVLRSKGVKEEMFDSSSDFEDSADWQIWNESESSSKESESDSQTLPDMSTPTIKRDKKEKRRRRVKPKRKPGQSGMDEDSSAADEASAGSGSTDTAGMKEEIVAHDLDNIDTSDPGNAVVILTPGNKRKVIGKSQTTTFSTTHGSPSMSHLKRSVPVLEPLDHPADAVGASSNNFTPLQTSILPSAEPDSFLTVLPEVDSEPVAVATSEQIPEPRPKTAYEKLQEDFDREMEIMLDDRKRDKLFDQIVKNETIQRECMLHPLSCTVQIVFDRFEMVDSDSSRKKGEDPSTTQPPKRQLRTIRRVINHIIPCTKTVSALLNRISPLRTMVGLTRDLLRWIEHPFFIKDVETKGMKNETERIYEKERRITYDTNRMITKMKNDADKKNESQFSFEDLPDTIQIRTQDGSVTLPLAPESFFFTFDGLHNAIDMYENLYRLEWSVYRQQHLQQQDNDLRKTKKARVEQAKDGLDAIFAKMLESPYVESLPNAALLHNTPPVTPESFTPTATLLSTRKVRRERSASPTHPYPIPHDRRIPLNFSSSLLPQSPIYFGLNIPQDTQSLYPVTRRSSSPYPPFRIIPFLLYTLRSGRLFGNRQLSDDELEMKRRVFEQCDEEMAEKMIVPRVYFATDEIRVCETKLPHKESQIEKSGDEKDQSDKSPRAKTGKVKKDGKHALRNILPPQRRKFYDTTRRPPLRQAPSLADCSFIFLSSATPILTQRTSPEEETEKSSPDAQESPKLFAVRSNVVERFGSGESFDLLSDAIVDNGDEIFLWFGGAFVSAQYHYNLHKQSGQKAGSGGSDMSTPKTLDSSLFQDLIRKEVEVRRPSLFNTALLLMSYSPFPQKVFDVVPSSSSQRFLFSRLVRATSLEQHLFPQAQNKPSRGLKGIDLEPQPKKGGFFQNIGKMLNPFAKRGQAEENDVSQNLDFATSFDEYLDMQRTKAGL